MTVKVKTDAVLNDACISVEFESLQISQTFFSHVIPMCRYLIIPFLDMNSHVVVQE